ncbi:3-alpha,7-alpha, 12-alpha-trihydroxy-5-beta-cholest-24-enoyl-CoA hydratase [Cupriavidus necator]|uniref:3-alpha,7-alpha, 12-alpha-trihydroxy-5-beta-cholest-24-enoyl-CoA hydratase n=1 Tax=Cupriavidus necator TaxID=106590 RepID=A0A1U9UYX4_CUPNE|nr:MaoC family dehydratase [Cupriavidus necator]AQV97431.1 3-alpha,7-alpha, 12-alpha-trihydroxy-5-beta-cholest-24-enoyl-CoA hydratase [Cupriavidus necator]
MAIDYHRLRSWAFFDQVSSYTANDSIRYALSIGFGTDPMDEADLPFVFEEGLSMVPTFLATVGAPGAWASDPGTGIDWMQILHGEHRMRFFARPAASGAVRSQTRVSRVVDKGAGKGALVVTERRIEDHASGALLATVEHVSFCRADGGFATAAAPGDAQLEPLPAVPARAPDMTMSMPTQPCAALLYRLNGDRNPIHALPAAARQAGFERPILHGLCTYGMACRALLKQACGGDPSRLASLSVRFSSPFLPGETLRVEMWRGEGQVQFRALADERNVVVLSHGVADLHP